MEANEKLGNYVVQCIKGRKHSGFGYPHKKGHFISNSGEGVFDINKAAIYNDHAIYNNQFPDLWDDSTDPEEFDKKYYKCIPVTIVIK